FSAVAEPAAEYTAQMDHEDGLLPAVGRVVQQGGELPPAVGHSLALVSHAVIPVDDELQEHVVQPGLQSDPVLHEDAPPIGITFSGPVVFREDDDERSTDLSR